mgnify:CR=1 FL=1
MVQIIRIVMYPKIPIIRNNNNSLFDYLYNIAISISIKNKLLPSWKDYEPFALYLATQTYMRLFNPK